VPPRASPGCVPDAQNVERLNAAYRLLARGQSVGEAALSLLRQFAMSRRQAYRYIEEVQLIGRPVPVVETATAVTFKLPPSLVDAVRARAATEGTW
jgi:predicted DNA-binding transcriptional regulator YafY